LLPPFLLHGLAGKKIIRNDIRSKQYPFHFAGIGGFVGGKFFMIFEEPRLLFLPSMELLRGGGFVFYGSLLFTIPTMLWFFKKNQNSDLGHAGRDGRGTCIVHGFGRIGCFMAGCCYANPR